VGGDAAHSGDVGLSILRFHPVPPHPRSSYLLPNQGFVVLQSHLKCHSNERAALPGLLVVLDRYAGERIEGRENAEASSVGGIAEPADHRSADGSPSAARARPMSSRAAGPIGPSALQARSTLPRSTGLVIAIVCSSAS
jgi:hypothetical protein